MSNVALYEQQLVQIQEALKTCDNGEDRANLVSLENDLKELVRLENLENERSDDEKIDVSIQKVNISSVFWNILLLDTQF